MFFRLKMSDRDRFFGSYDANHLLGSSSVSHRLGLDPYHISNSMKPRMRICFDPETELPKLQKWFKENNHPTRQQVSHKINKPYFSDIIILGGRWFCQNKSDSFIQNKGPRWDLVWYFASFGILPRFWLAIHKIKLEFWWFYCLFYQPNLT